MVEFVHQVGDLYMVPGSVSGEGLPTRLCHSAQTLQPLRASFACRLAGSLGSMDPVKKNRFVPRPNQNRPKDGLWASLGALTLPILFRTWRGPTAQA
jgi:hypothetical protein